MKRLYSLLLLPCALLVNPQTSCAQNTCAASQVIASLPFSQSGLTTCGKVNDYQNFCAENNYMDGEDFVFRYTPSTSSCINLNLTGTLNYTSVFIFSGCPNASGACVAKAVSTTGNPSLSQVALTGGTTYYIIVDTWPAPNCTPFNISIATCPVGSSCSNPKIIPSLPFQENNTTCGSGANFGSFQTPYGSCGPAFNDDGEDLVYTYTATRNQCINVSVTGWSFPGDGAFTISKSCPTASNSGCIAVREGSGSTGPAPANAIQVFAGTTLYITIDADDFNVTCQPFNIKIDTCATTVPQCSSSPPASDFCASATPICDFTGYCGSTSPTYTADQPSNINSVFCGSIENNSWVKFVAGATTATFNVYFGNCTNGNGIQALVLEATNCTNFVLKSNCYEPIAASGSGVITATNLTIGNTYLIMVDGYAGDYCDYILQANSGVLLPVDAGPDVTICPGKSVTLTASNGNNVYSWSPGGQTSKSITVTPTATTDYIVNSSSGNIGCPSPDKDTVRVTVVPTVIATVSSVVNANTCTGTCDGSAAISINGGQTPYNTVWSHGPTTTSVNALCPGNTYNVTVTDNLGCQSSVSVTMPPPVIADVNFTAPPCGTSSVTLTTVASTGTGVFTYTGPGTLNITNAGGGNYTASTSTFGSYDVTWTVTDGACSRSVTKTVVFRQTPVANFTITTPVCGSKTTTLTTTTTSGTGSFTFSGPGAITFTNTGGNNYSATATVFGAYNITWLVNNGGCTATITKTVTFTAQPTSSFTVTPPSCNSLNFTVATTATTGIGAWSYTGPASSVLTFTSTGANSYSASASQYGTYNITWTVNNAPCSATSTQSVTFDRQPVADAGLNQNICGLSSSFAAAPSFGSGLWGQVSGPATATITTTSSATSTVSTAVYGTYTFRWTEVNGSCPPSTDDMVIVFSQNPAGNAGPDQNICAFTTNLAGVATIGSGVWSGSGIATPTNATTSVTTASAGVRTYTWTISNGACPALIDQINVTFYKAPTPDAGADQSECGLSASLNALPPTAAGSWIAPGTASFTSVTDPKSNASVPGYGTYNFVWQETNGPCAARRDTVRITFVETPTPNAGPDQAICGLATSFNAASSPFTGNWTGPAGVTNPGSRTSTVTAPGYGAYMYVWTEFNAAPCPGKTDTVVVNFVQEPIANAGPDKNVCGSSTSLAAVRSVGGSTGLWSGVPGAVYGNVTQPNTGVIVPDYGTYTFTWTETNGSICPNSADQVTVTFVPPSDPNAGPDDAVCGLSSSLGAIPSFGLGTWSYSGPGILSFSDVNDPRAVINSNAFGNYNLAWTEGASPCLANTDTVVVAFSEPPTVDAGLSPDKVCGLDYRLNAFSSVGSAKWNWVPAMGVSGNISFASNNDTIPSPLITATAYGEYFLIWKLVNGPCVPPADTIALTFYERPAPDAGPDIMECDTLRAQLSGLTSIIGQWQWSSPSGGVITFSPDADRPDPIAVASVPGIYKLFFSEVNDPVCGITTDSLTVNFLSKPVSNAGSDATACGTNFILGANEPSVGVGTWSVVNSSDPGYTASFDDSSLFNTQAVLSANPPPAGVTITFRWSIKNGSCPVVVDDIDVIFTQVPNSVDAGIDQIICNALSGNISANDFGGTGNWLIIAKPSGAIASVNTPSSENAVLSGDKYGSYTLERTVNVAGCPNGVVDVVVVDFRRLPTPDAGLDDTICGPVYSLTGVAPTGRITGKWSQISGPGAAVFANDSLATSSVSIPSDQYGLYNFQWLESNLGCPNVPSTVDILFEQQPIANAGNDFSVCGLVFNLQATPSSASSSANYVGQWQAVSGPGTSTFSPVDGKDPLSQLNVSTFGKYTLTWTEVNGVCPLSLDSLNLQFVNPSNPDAGPAKDACGLVDTLAAVPSFGVGEWISSPLNIGLVSFVNPADPATIVGVSDFGTYRFDWLEANSPCFANSDFTQITFNEQPAALAGYDADTCGLVYQLSAQPSVSGPGYLGTWSGPIGSIFSGVNNPQATVDVSSVGFGTHTFVWTEVNGTACSASIDAVDITFVQTPLADIGVVPASICGTFLDLTALPSLGVGQWSATGSNDFNFSNPTNPNSVGVGDDFGLYTLYWKETNFGTNGGSCSSIDSAAIQLYPQPTAYAGADSAVCGNSITLTGLQSVSSSLMAWKIVGNTGDATVTPSTSQVTNITTNNVYGLLYFVFSENVGSGTCLSSDTVAVNFVKQPVADAGISDSVCALTANLTAVPSIGNGGWTSLTPGVVFNPDLSNPSPTITAPSYGIFKFVWKEDNGAPCLVSRDTATIGFFKIPQPKAGPDFSVCGTVATLNATVGIYPGLWTYTGPLAISFANATNPKSNVTLAPTSSADYSLVNMKWRETNVICTATDQVAVYFSERPNANAGPDQSVCGKDFTLTAVPSVGNGHWEYPGVDTDLSSFTNVNSPNATGTTANYGVYPFNWIEQNPGTCPSDTDQTRRTFNQLPIASAGPDSSVCSLSHRLTAVASAGSGSWAKVSGPGIVTFANPINDTSFVTVSVQGNYSFKWTEVNSASCPTSIDTVKIYFERAPIANAGPDISICGSATNLKATPSIGTGQWTFVGDPSANITFGNANSPTTSFTSNQFGAHGLIWLEMNTAVCGPRTDTMVVTFVQQPIAEAGGPVYNICGSSLDLEAVPTAGVGQWSQVSGPAAGSFNSAFDPTTNFAAATNGFGSYTLRWTEDNATPCTPSFEEIDVNFSQQPNANAGLPSEVCGLSGSLTAIPSVGVGSWQLLPSGTQSALFNNFNQAATTVDVNQYGDFQFVWREQNGNVCPPDLDVVIVSFKEAPTAKAGPDQATCGLSTQLNSISTSGIGIWSLPASSPLTFADSSSNTSTVTSSVYGTYLVIWTEVNGKVCPISVDSLEVDFAEQPIANAGPDDRVCGQTYQLGAVPSVGSGSWSSNSSGATYNPSNTDPNATVTIDTYGSFRFTWTEINRVPCAVSTNSTNIDFILGPTGNLAATPDTSCAGDPVSLTLNLSGTGPFNIIYTSNGGSPVTVNGVNNGDQITVNPMVTTVYNITEIEDGSGESCKSTSSIPVTVTVNPRPTGIVTGSYQVCTGSELTIPISFTGTPPFTAQFTNSETQVFDGPGPYSYTYQPGILTSLGMTTVSDAYCSGTPDPSTASIVINPLPAGTVSQIGGPTCQNTPIQLRFDFSAGTAPWKVYLSNGSSQQIIDATTNAFLITEIPAVGVTTYNIDSIIDGNGCKGSGGSTAVTVYANPTYSIISDSVICQNSSTNAVFSFTPAGSGPWVVDYNYTGNFTSTPALLDGGSIVLSPLSSTSYAFTRVTDQATGCFTDLAKDLNMTVVPTAVLTASIDKAEICRNETATITFTYAGIEPFEVTLNNNVTYSGLRNGDKINVSPIADTTFTIIGFKDGSGIICPSNVTMNLPLIVNQLPPIDFNLTNTSSCAPMLPIFANTTDPSYIASSGGCFWDFGDGSTSTDIQPVHQFNNSGIYAISLIVVSDKGCRDTLVKPTSININPDPVANFSWTPEKPTLIINEVQFLNNSTGAKTFNWDLAGLLATSAISPYFIFPNDDSATYRICLTAVSDSGCVNTHCDNLFVSGEMAVFVPTAFTPDGDGLNDVFIPSVLGSDITTYEFLVFDRWGEVIFSSDNPTQGWDGKVDGRMVKTDVYPWKLTFKDKYTVTRHQYLGKVNLIK